VARRFIKPVVTSQADFHAASPSEWQVAWAGPLSGQQIVVENPPNNVSVVIGLLAIDPPEFMEREIRKNDYILIICVPKYKAKSEPRPVASATSGS
jgi:hypothetical protein